MKKMSLIAVAVSLSLFVGCSEDSPMSTIVGSDEAVESEEIVESVDTTQLFSAGEEKFYLGLLPTPDEEYESFPRAVADVSRAIARKVDLSSRMPRPGNQGRQNSCTAWAAGYAYKSYQERKDHNKNMTFSVSYIYNQTNGGKNVGIYMHYPFQLMQKQGVCTSSSMGYNQNDWRTQPNSRQREEARRYKAKSWGTIASGSVSQIKAHLAGGDPVAVGVPVYSDINVSNSNPIYDRMNGRLSGHHAICLVGYDDSKQAFKFMNSWGTRWGFGGYGWISYNMIQQNRVKGYVMTDVKTGGSDNTTTINTWSYNKTYYRGNRVKYRGAEWIAQRTSRSKTPTTSSTYYWKKVGGDNTDDKGNNTSTFHIKKTYNKGSVVIHRGAKYIAQWWVKGEVPGSKKWGAWKRI